MPRPILEILDELKSALAEDALVLSAEQALAAAEAGLELETVAHAWTTRAIKTVDDLAATTELCGRTTKSWLIEDEHVSLPAAGRRMKLVRFLDAFPLVKAAYHAAEISAEHVSALISALLTLPHAWQQPVEAPLLDAARGRLSADEDHGRLLLRFRVDRPGDRRAASRGDRQPQQQDRAGGQTDATAP